MERAVAREILALALGQHDALPSAEELAELVATAQLALLVAPTAIPESLLTTAWYLHGIASSPGAQERYGVDRQRAAFRVAAHIFDLSLRQPELDHRTRLRQCFAAQVAYLRSELNPNSIALYKREFGSGLPNRRSLITSWSEAALEIGICLLGMDLSLVVARARLTLDEARDRETFWEIRTILDTMFGAAMGVVQGARALAVFLRAGTGERLEEARGHLVGAILNEPAAGDRDSRWVAAHLLDLSDGLASSSVWTVLPPEVPPEVRRAFAYVNPPVLTLWPPQVDFLGTADPDHPNPLSSDAKRLFVATPTSSGKTLIAQLLIATHLAAGHEGSVCYVAPTRTLCHEVHRALDRRLRFIARRIESDLPEWLDIETILLEPGVPRPDVEVMTPERLAFLLRTDSQQVLQRFGMFIFDEVHNVAEPGRGWVLESELSFLHNATLNKHHRIVLMSAAVGNRHHIIQWMSSGDQRVVPFHSDWRGPRRLHCIWNTQADFQQPEVVHRPRSLPRTKYPVYGKLYVRTGQREPARLDMQQPVGELVRRKTKGNKTITDPESTAKYRMLVPLIEHLEVQGPVLVVESTRAASVRMAHAIAEGQQRQDVVESPEIAPLVALAEARLGAEHPLTTVLRHGVAYHHSSLPAEIRAGIEDAVTEGHLTCLVATTTMTEGVNLPVRSVIVSSLGYQDGKKFVEILKGSRLLNAIGRAGRAAKETEGVVVLVSAAGYKAADFNRLSPTDEQTSVVSALATTEALV